MNIRMNSNDPSSAISVRNALRKSWRSGFKVRRVPRCADPGYQTDFDIATVFYEQKNDGETLTLSRWSAEQRRRRLQGDEE